MDEIQLATYIEEMDDSLRVPWSSPRAKSTVCFMEPDGSTDRDAELATIELRRRHPEIPRLSVERVRWSRSTPSETLIARYR